MTDQKLNLNINLGEILYTWKFLTLLITNQFMTKKFKIIFTVFLQ